MPAPRAAARRAPVALLGPLAEGLGGDQAAAQRGPRRPHRARGEEGRVRPQQTTGNKQNITVIFVLKL